MINKFILDIETVGLESTTDRILSIGVLNVEHQEPVIFYGEDEARILTQFWAAIKDAEEIITFNGDEFDIPFLIKRSIINNIPISQIQKSVDLRKVCNSFKFSYKKMVKGSLRFWAEIMNFSVKTEDGSKMIEFYEKKDWKSIQLHNSEDLQITKSLYNRCLFCNIIKEEKKFQINIKDIGKVLTETEKYRDITLSDEFKFYFYAQLKKLGIKNE